MSFWQTTFNVQDNNLFKINFKEKFSSILKLWNHSKAVHLVDNSWTDYEIFIQLQTSITIMVCFIVRVLYR